MESPRRLLLAGCALMLMAGVAGAESGPVWSDDQLAQFSSAIVSGRVTDVSVGRDVQTNAIYTYVTVAVDDALKGDITERQVVLKQLGGQIGDEGLGVAGQAVFARDEEVLVFLETRPRDGTLYTTALWQGKWTIDRDTATGERIATRSTADHAARSAVRGEGERRALTAFVAGLRMASQTAGPRLFVTTPAAEEMGSAITQSVVGARFTLLSTPWRWNEFDSGTPIPIDVQTGGQPGLSGGGINELIVATAIWSTPTGLKFAAGGSSSRCFGAGNASARISVVFTDPCGEMSASGGTLAIGGASFTTSGGRTVNGIAFARAVDGYIVNNNSASALKFLENSGCFVSVDTREFGRVLGLDHSQVAAAIMMASASFAECSSVPVAISSDDTTGIQTIYPPTGSAIAPGISKVVTSTVAGVNPTAARKASPASSSRAAKISEVGSSSLTSLGDGGGVVVTADYIQFKPSGPGNGTGIVTPHANTDNTFFGMFAGKGTATGFDNAGFGMGVLASITTGNYNTGVGQGAFDALTTGSNNTGMGVAALKSLITGGSNTAIGFHALYKNDSTSNVAVGAETLSLSTSNSNTAVGYQAGVAVGSGAQNTIVGAQAGVNITSGHANTALGYWAGISNTGAGNVFLGANAGGYETGSGKLFIDNALRANEPDGRAKALIYGVFASTVEAQTLALNAAVTVASNLTAASVRGAAVAFASLPVSPVEGMMVPVTDSNTATWGATVAAGGSDHVLAYYNGTVWTVAAK